MPKFFKGASNPGLFRVGGNFSPELLIQQEKLERCCKVVATCRGKTLVYCYFLYFFGYQMEIEYFSHYLKQVRIFFCIFKTTCLKACDDDVEQINWP